MRNNEKYAGEWLLLNKKGNIIEHNKDVITIIEKGKKYSPGEVSIEQKIPHGTPLPILKSMAVEKPSFSPPTV